MKKNTIKQLLAVVLCLSMAALLFGCGSKTDAEPAASAEATEAAADASADDAVYTVGICQLVTHEALDAATQGFKDALTEEFGDKVVFEEQNAAGDSNANATPALQAAAAATADIPILGTSVTEYGVALDIKDFGGTVGGNISGTSDLAPLDKQADMLAEWCPVEEYPNVGLIYCSAEANSQYQVDTVKGYLDDMGYTCTLYPFSDSNDFNAVAQAAVDASDVIYAPTDNTVASNVGILDNLCSAAEVPVIAGEEGICRGCGVATLSISYYDLGVTTGKMAAQILKGEADISEMPVAYAEDFTPEYNAEICERLGLTAPEGYTALEAE